jgi:MFS family permease
MHSTANSSDRSARASRVAFVAIVLAMLPAVLDQTILATALPTIATDLGRLADVSWVVTGYVVSAAVATPLWGKLGDRHGSGTIALGRTGRADVIDGVHTVFLVTAPIALLALIAVIAIKEVPLRRADKPPQQDATPRQATSSPPAPATAA